MTEGFTEAQLVQLRAMMAEFRAILGPPGPPGPSGNSGDPGVPRTPGQNAVNEDTPRFLNNDVGFFDPFYDDKSNDIGAGIKHAEKDTYFRDVTMFIDKIKDVARVKGVKD